MRTVRRPSEDKWPAVRRDGPHVYFYGWLMGGWPAAPPVNPPLDSPAPTRHARKPSPGTITSISCCSLYRRGGVYCYPPTVQTQANA